MTTEIAHQFRCPSCDYWYAVDEWDVEEMPIYSFAKAEPERIIQTSTCPGCKAPAQRGRLGVASDRVSTYYDNRPEHLAFLDKRIPELQAIGKPILNLPANPTLEQEVAAVVQLASVADFLGRDARTQADREWYARRGK